MKIGTGCYYINRYGTEEGARKMAELGYECIDFDLSDAESEYYSAKEEFFFISVSKLKKSLSSNGITVNQIHGPWRFPSNEAAEEDRADRFGKMTKAASIAKFLGAKYMAVHPLMPFGAESAENPDVVYEINRRFYKALSDVTGKLGVTLCLENMPFREFPLSSTESLLKLIEDINSPHLKLCFDTGHAHLLGEDLGNSIRKAGEKLKALHVHDNFGDKDAHLPPYDGSIDWGEVAEALFDIGYNGVINLETSPKKCGSFKNMTEEEIAEKELSISKVAKLLAGDF